MFIFWKFIKAFRASFAIPLHRISFPSLTKRLIFVGGKKKRIQTHTHIHSIYDIGIYLFRVYNCRKSLPWVLLVFKNGANIFALFLSCPFCVISPAIETMSKLLFINWFINIDHFLLFSSNVIGRVIHLIFISIYINLHR